jgi:hypothetical protein
MKKPRQCELAGLFLGRAFTLMDGHGAWTTL